MQCQKSMKKRSSIANRSVLHLLKSSSWAFTVETFPSLLSTKKNPSLDVPVIRCLVKCFHCLAVSFSLFLCCCLLCCSTSNRLWAEDSTEKEKDSVSTAVTVPVAPSVVNAAATTTAMTTATSGTVSSTSEVRERRRCVKVLRVTLLSFKRFLGLGFFPT